MSIHSRALHGSASYPVAASKEPHPRIRRVWKSWQGSDGLGSTHSWDYIWGDAGIADWDSTISLGVKSRAANSIGHDMYNEPPDPKIRTSFSWPNANTDLNHDQGIPLDFTLSALQSPEASTDTLTISKIKKGQTDKRREQNKRSQQAYRARRAEYASSLESKVEEMHECLERLQLENRDILRHICDLRAKNNILRSSSKETEMPKGSLASSSFAQSPATSGSETRIRLSQKDIEALYEPYLAVWNLLSTYLPPESRPEDYAAVLEHLQAMAMQRMKKGDQNRTVGKD